jgi:hypothetical protein
VCEQERLRNSAVTAGQQFEANGAVARLVAVVKWSTAIAPHRSALAKAFRGSAKQNTTKSLLREYTSLFLSPRAFSTGAPRYAAICA